MDLGRLAELSVGLAAFLGALFLLLKYKPWKNGNSHHSEVEEAGKVEREVWESFFKEEIRKDGEITRKSIREENESAIEDIRKLLESRVVSTPKDILEPILKDLKDTRHDLRGAISTAIANAYLQGRRDRDV